MRYPEHRVAETQAQVEEHLDRMGRVLARSRVVLAHSRALVIAIDLALRAAA